MCRENPTFFYEQTTKGSSKKQAIFPRFLENKVAFNALKHMSNGDGWEYQTHHPANNAGAAVANKAMDIRSQKHKYKSNTYHQ